MAKDFSKRYGFKPRPAQMVREEAPDQLRTFVLRHISGESIHKARDSASSILNYVPNPANQSVGEIWKEIEHAVRTCEWFLVYDLIEEIYRNRQWGLSSDADKFASEVNEFFSDHNIGWQLRAVPTGVNLVGGINLLAPEIIFRGDEAFERTFTIALNELEASSRNSAMKELDEAVRDLSRRPEPDLTGAVHHAINALESVAADVCGEGGQTLGQIVKHNPDRFPQPLGEAVSKLYGFASDRGRHLTEGKTPTQREAEFVVSISAALMAFLLR